MAASKEYGYYLRGKDIAVIQKDYDLDGGQSLTQPGLNDIGRSGTGAWKSPKETITDGLEIEYTYVPQIVDEASTIDIPHHLARALVYYMKARMAEDQNDFRASEVLMAKFRKLIEEHENTRIWGNRQIVSGPNAIR